MFVQWHGLLLALFLLLTAGFFPFAIQGAAEVCGFKPLQYPFPALPPTRLQSKQPHVLLPRMATKKTPKTFSLITRPKLLALYTALLRCRMMADLAAAASPASKAGHEAPAVAVALDLKPGDTIGAARRDFLPGFVNGTSPEATLAALRGSPAQLPASFAAMLKATLAAARAHAQRKNRNIAAIFARGASASSAAWIDALQTAGAERLPILFVSQPGSQPPETQVAARSSLGFPTITVDADDAIAIYRVASEAQAHARRGNGPTLIECVPWPLAVPQDGATATNDPIPNMERYLAQMRIPFARWKRKAIEDFGRNVRISRATAPKRLGRSAK